jgi:hypothetical protein
MGDQGGKLALLVVLLNPLLYPAPKQAGNRN